MRVVALFSTSFFAKCLRVGEDGPGQGHPCHTDTFLVYFSEKTSLDISCELSANDSHKMSRLLFSEK